MLKISMILFGLDLNLSAESYRRDTVVSSGFTEGLAKTKRGTPF